MMNNPGLDVFAAGQTYIKSPNHPLNIDPMEDDPFLEEDDNDSDYVPPVNFGRWRTPGQSVRVPIHQGPSFAPGEAPEDVIHGEVISPEEQDGADHILNGDHESGAESANPFVERARQDLHQPGSSVTVHALSRLLSNPRAYLHDDEMETAHEYLSRHFTGVRVNPRHGTLVAQSPHGTQLVRRHRHLPAVPEKPAPEEPKYTLENKHGTFESDDSQRLIRMMIAFQVMHNEYYAQKKRKEEEDDDDDQSTGLIATSAGFFRGLRDAFMQGYSEPAPKGAIFEPGNGIDRDHGGRSGGYVMDAAIAPSHWLRGDPDNPGVAYSPGHYMRLRLDPRERAQVRSDSRHPGHTFTLAPSPLTGHTIARRAGDTTYWVSPLHPAVRNKRDVPPAPPKPAPGSGPGARRRAPRPPSLPSAESAVKVNDLCPVCASGYLEPYDSQHHECLNCGSLVTHMGIGKEAARNYEDEPTDSDLDEMFAEHDRLGDEYDQHRREHGVAHPDDWSDLPSGETRSLQYKRTPDGLVEHHWEDDFLPPHTAAPRRKPGGLGRGLGQILQPVGDPLNLGTGGSENPDNVEDAPEEGYVHPLAGEQPPEDYEEYEAPRRILDKKATEADPLDSDMGKFGFFPIHREGEERTYLAQMPGTDGFLRLTEGAPHPKTGKRGWVLTADSVNPRERWLGTRDPHRDQPVPRKYVNFDTTNDPGKKLHSVPLPDLGEYMSPETSILAAGTHPIEDDSLNRAIRDVTRHGRNSQTYRNVYERTEYVPAPRLLTEVGAPYSSQEQRRMRGLSATNPGLGKFAAYDPETEEPCTHCNGSGVDPEYGDECSRCGGSGAEPND